jgi:hypothetical protein
MLALSISGAHVLMANRSALAVAIGVVLGIAVLVIFYAPDWPTASPQLVQPADEAAFVQAVTKAGTLATEEPSTAAANERLKLIDKALPVWRISDWTGRIAQFGLVVFTVRIGPGITLFMRQPPAENRAQLQNIAQSVQWRIDQLVRFSGEFVSGDNGYAAEAVAPGEIPKQPQFFFRFSRVEPLD